MLFKKGSREEPFFIFKARKVSQTLRVCTGYVYKPVRFKRKAHYFITNIFSTTLYKG